MNISPSIEGSRIVTGYTTIGNQKFSNSVIEYEHDGKTIVLDWTRNLKITKEQYIELTKFVELSSFESRKSIDGIEIIFRNELIRNMQRKPHIFQSTEKCKKSYSSVYKQI